MLEIVPDTQKALRELTLLVSIERLREDVVTCQDHDDGEIFVNQGQDTVLQFTGHDSLAVKI